MCSHYCSWLSSTSLSKGIPGAPRSTLLAQVESSHFVSLRWMPVTCILTRGSLLPLLAFELLGSLRNRRFPGQPWTFYVEQQCEWQKGEGKCSSVVPRHLTEHREGLGHPYTRGEAPGALPHSQPKQYRLIGKPPCIPCFLTVHFRKPNASHLKEKMPSSMRFAFSWMIYSLSAVYVLDKFQNCISS